MVFFEEWADNEEDARKLLESGEVKLIPCHHVDAVGPMGGITSANMAVLIVENRTDGNKAYCTMNEGIGAVLRFGAYSNKVITRFSSGCVMCLAKHYREVLKTKEGGLNVNVLVAKAIWMGDEFHQRNIAASLAFLKEIAPILVRLDIDQQEKEEVMQFLADTINSS